MRKSLIASHIGMYLIAFAAADGGLGGAPEEEAGGLDVQTGFLSLADLAGANTDGITTLTSRVPPAGIWRIRGKQVKGTQSEPTDGKPPLIRFGFQYTVMGGKPADPEYDAEKMVDRVLTESYTIWPSDMDQCIGLLKGRYQKVGLPNSGMPMGGVEGLEPGWLDGFVGAEFDLKIRTSQRNGDTVAYYDWLAAPVDEAVED